LVSTPPLRCEVSDSDRHPTGQRFVFCGQYPSCQTSRLPGSHLEKWQIPERLDIQPTRGTGHTPRRACIYRAECRPCAGRTHHETHNHKILCCNETNVQSAVKRAGTGFLYLRIVRRSKRQTIRCQPNPHIAHLRLSFGNIHRCVEVGESYLVNQQTLYSLLGALIALRTGKVGGDDQA
jgi:hypothetical protein